MASFRRCLLALGAAEFSGVAALQVGTDQRPRMCWKMCKTNADGIASSLTENNLGGSGPNSNDEERMVYKKVAKEGPKHLDLVVTLNPRSREEFGAYNPWNSTVNGQHKCFGVVNVRNQESVMLDFSFHDHATGKIHVVNKAFGFTVFDVDHSGDPGQEETVLFNTPPLPGQTVVGEDLIRDPTSTGDLRIMSKAIGNGADNPLDANGEWAPLPEEASRARAVDVTYKDESTWTVTFSSKGGRRGRNFLFFGCEEGEPDAFVGDERKEKKKNGKKKKNWKKSKKAIETDLPNVPDVPNKPPVPDKSSLPPVPGAAEAAKIAVPVVATLVAAVFA